jgi:peptidase E
VDSGDLHGATALDGGDIARCDKLSGTSGEAALWTESMLALWNAWEMTGILRSAADNGTILAGVSAGAVCWFDYALTDAHHSSYTALPGLGFIAGSCCPHYSSEPQRRPVFEHSIARGELPNGIAIDDGVAVHLRDGKPIHVISARPGATAYSVCRMGERIETETQTLAITIL